MDEILNELPMEENTTTYYVLLSEDNRITTLTVSQQSEEQIEFAFPSDFNVSDIINYKIIDGELVYDEFPIEPIEPTVPIEDRVESLENNSEVTFEALETISMEEIPNINATTDELFSTIEDILTNVIPTMLGVTE